MLRTTFELLGRYWPIGHFSYFGPIGPMMFFGPFWAVLKVLFYKKILIAIKNRTTGRASVLCSYTLDFVIEFFLC